MPTYPGGKAGSGVYQRIICEQPPHDVYIEPFLGAGAVMRRKRPAAANIGIDADPVPVSRARAMFDRAAWLQAPLAGDGEWRLFEFVHGDGIAWLAGRTWTGRELVYCDPPYLLSTRSCHRPIYRCELEARDHIALLDVLVQLPCMVQVSGYWSEMYALGLSSWRVVRYRTVARSGGIREECLWMNYPEPEALHTWWYLGRDYRERERIKRMHSRWLARLARMGRLERGALLAALEGSRK